MECYKCKEYINVEILNKIISSALVDEVSIIHLKKLKKRVQKTGFHTLTFTAKEKLDKKPCGRLYPKDNIPSLQNIKKEIRKALCFENYLDLDIKSCFPTILNKLLNDFNLNCPTLHNYITNGEISFDKSKLRVMINTNEWHTEDEKEMACFKDINEKVNKLINLPCYKAYKSLGEAKNESNPMGTAVSFILQDAERQIMTIVINILRKNNYETGTLIHDGVLIRANSIKPEVIEEIQREILDQTDFDVKFSIKPMDYNDEALFVNETKAEQEFPSYEEVKIEFEKTNFLLTSKAVLVNIQPDGTLIFRKEKDFHLVNASGLYCSIWNEDKGIFDNKQFTKLWINDTEKIRSYNKIDFLPPPLETPEGIYNEWNRFAVEKMDVLPNENYIGFLEHMKMLFNYDEAVYDYFIKYLAHIFQFPSKLNGIVFVIRGGEGCGKSTIMKFISKLLGAELYYSTPNADQDIFGRFSVGRVNKLVVNIDDNDPKGFLQHSTKFKNAITEPTLNYELKGHQPFTVNNFNRFIITTNSITTALLDKNDRRYVLIDCNNEKSNDRDYFTNLYNILEDDGAMIGLYNYLKQVDITNVNWINDRPITEFYLETKNFNRGAIIELMDYLLFTDKSFFMEETREINAREFYIIYTNWCGNDKPLTETKFFFLLKDYFKNEFLMKDSAICKKRTKIGSKYVLNRTLLYNWLLNGKHILDTPLPPLGEEGDDSE